MTVRGTVIQKTPERKRGAPSRANPPVRTALAWARLHKPLQTARQFSRGEIEPLLARLGTGLLLFAYKDEV